LRENEIDASYGREPEKQDRNTKAIEKETKITFSSASSLTKPPSPASSAPCCPNRTTNGQPSAPGNHRPDERYSSRQAARTGTLTLQLTLLLRIGRIVNIGSIDGQAGQYGQVNYAAAKSGIHGFTKALALEGARFSVAANAIVPGYVDTEMVRALPPDVLEKIIAKIPRGRLGTAASPDRRSRSMAASICTDGAAAALLTIRSRALSLDDNF
jgi:NAD(P)-dependent dehydrogenase (short-subunit alcohol dehydrogenase family)